ncbi:hydantoinase/oxoprolinase family protein [Reyranella sp.]|uniref:hydantoinase/oxoprolinase family protein n=1 Tax=Reyranella sp. TaxID=1929291 RepID=UPI003BACF8B8
MGRFSIAVDIGGTFTDFVLLDEGRNKVVTTKVLSTPHEPDAAIFDGLGQLQQTAGFDLAGCDMFLHATTLITNAVIERKGHDFILLHTEGFGTTLETAREHRYNLTNLRLLFPRPISKRALKLAVQERVSSAGAIVAAPDRSRVLAGVRRLVDETGVRNFAICFLHSFRNAANEQAVAQWIGEEIGDATLSVSSAIAPQQSEYERWMTCAVNAYTKPLLVDYVRRLEGTARAKGFAGRLFLMTSSGLPVAVEHSVGTPVRLIESGPAAGVLAAKEIADRNRPSLGDDPTGTGMILAYDMGGTTSKGAYLVDGKVDVRSGLEVAREGAFEAGSGLPLRIPAIDLIEIGAGGGSIAEIDDRGVIGVGPRSAGADPGPACYGRGGIRPTVTDANLVLGFLGEHNFHNSGISVRTAGATAAIRATLAEPLAISPHRAALGIHRTINENVARAFRVHAAELGIDHRRATLVCTGGAAPIHALPIARLLGIERVIFPFAAGVASAMGLFAGHEGTVLQRSKLVRVADIVEGLVAREVADLIDSDAYARRLAGDGAVTVVKAGMRYQGQDSEVTVEIGRDGRYPDRDGIRSTFLETYRGIFGLDFPSYEIEISSWSVEITRPAPLKGMRAFAYDALRATGLAQKGHRDCYLGQDRREAPTRVPVFDRYALAPGWRAEGAALIEENDTTIYIPPGAHVDVAPSLDLIARWRR